MRPRTYRFIKVSWITDVTDSLRSVKLHYNDVFLVNFLLNINNCACFKNFRAYLEETLVSIRIM